jgi:uncharacterized membrane protein YgcG
MVSRGFRLTLALVFSLPVAAALAVPLPQPRPSDLGPLVDPTSVMQWQAKKGDRVALVSEAQAQTAAPAAAPAAAPPATTTTVTTDAPPTISFGTVAGQVLTWAAAAWGSVIATAIVALLARLFSGVGFNLDTARRARLQSIVENGLSLAASKIAKTADGKIPWHAKNQVVADAVNYAVNHGADTIKALGLIPGAQATVDAIRARVEKALADPSVPVNAQDAPAGAAPVQSPGAAPDWVQQLGDRILGGIQGAIQPRTGGGSGGSAGGGSASGGSAGGAA